MKGKERFNWCSLTKPPCPYQDLHKCGISRWLSAFSSREVKATEVGRLETLVKEDPEAFRRTCERGWLGQ